jgi:hypothetical protein
MTPENQEQRNLSKNDKSRQELGAKAQAISTDAAFMLRMLTRVESQFPSKKKTLIALEEMKEKFQKNLEDICKSCTEAEDIISKDSQIHLIFADEVKKVENEIEDMRGLWPDGRDVVKTREAIDMLKQTLERIRLHTGIIAAPALVREQLKQVNVGAAFDFHYHLSGDLEDEKVRLGVLQYLHRHQVLISGVVDPESGLIYRASTNVWRRATSLVAFLVAIFAGYGVIHALVGNWLGWSDLLFPGMDLGGLETAYTLALCGGLAHLLVAFLKLDRSSKKKFYWGISDWFLLIHVREVEIFIRGASFIVIVLASYKMMDGLELGTAFFLGYSADSVLDLLLQRFDALAKLRTQQVGASLEEAIPVALPSV